MGAKRRKKRGIKQKAVLSKITERTAQNRVIFGAGAKKEKSRNPHGYWIFRWRSGWDSNPRAREDYLISSQARYDHFDTAPYMFSRRFSSLFSDRKRLWKELTERTANYSVFRTVENPHGYKVFGGRNGQLPARFRVRAVMTSSILLRVYLNCLQNFKLDLQVADFWKLFLETVKNNAIQFSCKPSHNAVCSGLELH